MEHTIPFHESGSRAPLSARIATAEMRAAVRRSLQSRIAGSLAWSVLGSGILQGGSFLSSVLLARILGREVFGQFALIQSTVNALTYLASLGLGLTATKYISEYRATKPEKIGKLLGLSWVVVLTAGLCFSIGLAVCAPMLAVRAEHCQITPGLRISTVCVFFQTLTGYQLGILAGFENFRSIAAIGIICGSAAPLLSWLGAVRLGLPGAVSAQCTCAVLLWLLCEMAVRAECRKRGVLVEFRGAWEERSVLTRVSIPAAACGMAGSLAAWGSNTLLARACGYSELALFTAVGNLRSLVIFLPALIFRVAAPRLNYMFAAGNLPGYSRALWGTAGVNSGLAFCCALLAFLGGRQFVHLFGKAFAGSNWLIGIILCSVVIEVAANNLYIALIASCRFWRNLAATSVWATLLLAVSAVAAPRYGSSGIAIAYLASWSAAAAIYAFEARQQTRKSL